MIRITALATLMFFATACSTPKQSVEFLRGCWAQHDEPGGRVVAMLRLLPNGADVRVYRGLVQAIEGGASKVTGELAFSQNGRWMTVWTSGGAEAVRLRASPWPDGFPGDLADAPFRAAFVSDGDAGWVVAAGRDEELAIQVVKADRSAGEMLFVGDRDGCD